VIALLLCAGLAFRRIVEQLNGRFNPWAVLPAAVANSLVKLRSENDAFSEFVAAFRTGPSAMSHNSDSTAEHNFLNEFLTKTPKLLGELQRLLKRIAGASDPVAQTRSLSDLCREVRALKGEAGHSELLPVWQLASALEGLIKQLIDNASNVTPSTLRTVAGGVDVLDELCRPGLKADLLTNPPLRLLVVDDDPICRMAVSLALKKALNPPHQAENGEAALALAAQQAYDVIFLDVMMPGIDGFEACTRIHDTVPNRATPVVFVTTLRDFDSRAKATIKGGADLIGKPFLSFEITVKALTFALRGRLQAQPQIADANNRAINGATAHLPTLAGIRPVQNQLQEVKGRSGNVPLPEMLAGDYRPSQLVVSSVASGEQTRVLFNRASAQLGPLRNLIQAIFQITDELVRQQMLADFSLRLNDLTPRSDAATKHPTVPLIVALQGLLKKLLQNPKHCTSSSLLTIATAVDLLHDLCATRVKPDLAANPPIRILAVDDDPVARRAITCALQMAFEKPESVDSGEAALALATERPFDVIFLDVLMPGMDGFTTCFRIHETDQNHTTPVVFVTSYSDFKARSQATVSGGSDFMAKPFLTAEITVKALTYALRGRLQKLKMAENLILMPKQEEQTPDNLVPALA
jgi:CheY-like chemotaxis protein